MSLFTNTLLINSLELRRCSALLSTAYFSPSLLILTSSGLAFPSSFLILTQSYQLLHRTVFYLQLLKDIHAFSPVILTSFFCVFSFCFPYVEYNYKLFFLWSLSLSSSLAALTYSPTLLSISSPFNFYFLRTSSTASTTISLFRVFIFSSMSSILLFNSLFPSLSFLFSLLSFRFFSVISLIEAIPAFFLRIQISSWVSVIFLYSIGDILSPCVRSIRLQARS